MFPKSLLVIVAFVCSVCGESKIMVSVTNETQVDLQTYLADLQVAAASAQYSTNLNARLVNMLQELLAQKRVNCNCSGENSKQAYREKAFPLPNYAYVDNSSVGFKLYRERLTWNEARKSCRREKSDLAVPRSFLEYETMVKLLEQPSWQVKWIPAFLGLHHLYGKDDWLTVSGEPVPQWINHKHNLIATERPSVNRVAPDGHCTAIDGNLKLMSIDCNTPFSYICEIRP
ncbi:uncharacterized protein LOC100115211 [Nasonia vitripennis]|uniref:C-type lectin domain-containing protein n=1 Tax=Nasonia vitripennis TaxID=7425 RepID=A0A7M7G209_NASVI|nr:uncharacterized protein LOC100115211 [Nasonia vitripennis]